MKRLFFVFWLLMAQVPLCAGAGGPVDHRLEARVDPGTGFIRVVDRITLPEPADAFDFVLHADLEVTSPTPGALLRRTGSHRGPVSTHGYRVTLPEPGREIELRYEGTIRHGVDTRRDEYAGGRESTPGLISPEGVFLSGSSAWYPYIGGESLSFSLSTHLPEGWTAVSQGGRTPEGAWVESQPQDDIYLIAAPFTLYERATPRARAQVYLLRPDPELADRYLTATAIYLDLFSELIGPYPYAKFALVENFWQSGYGMPSFTLLGSRVIRLPFILHSSYPHEILHNWWGNSVYIDYGTGNWAEGLTAYLADHLVKEQAGAGAAYRRDTLQSYANYVDAGRDFPLVRFRGRHGQASQAVGYGKTAMLFHMLRDRLGDETFRRGLRRFFENHKFGTAGFSDLRSAFEAVSGADLGDFFRQWTTRTGAPRLRIEGPTRSSHPEGHRLRFSLRQAQAAPHFDLDVPIFVQVEGEHVARHMNLPMKGRELNADLLFDRPPLRVMVDPRFDLFRHLDASEIPASLGTLFAADRLTILLPSRAAPALKKAYRTIADQWAAHGDGVDVLWDDAIDGLPDGPIWLFGASNLKLRAATAAAGRPPVFDDTALDVDGTRYPYDRFSFAVTLGDAGRDARPLGWLNVHSPDAAPGLARKIVHYRKYSYALFEGEIPTNVEKGQWDLAESALSLTVAGEMAVPPVEIPEHPPLAGARTLSQ